MRRTSRAAWFLIGLSTETVRAVASSRAGWGVTGGLWSYGVANAEAFSEEVGLDAALGGGNGGVAGQLDARLLIGWRGYVTDFQGPFLRVGPEVQLFGSPLAFVSLPSGVIGYELVDNRVAFDVGLHGAFALSEIYGVYAGASRDVSDSPVFGAYAWLIARPVQASLRWDRLWPDGQGPFGTAPIDEVRASGCMATGRFALILCANFDIVSGPAAVAGHPGFFGTTEIAPSISLGFGGVGSGAEVPPPAR
jgi:hypothetical protein